MKKAKLHRSLLVLGFFAFMGLAGGAYMVAPQLYHKMTHQAAHDEEGADEHGVEVSHGQDPEAEGHADAGHEKMPEGHSRLPGERPAHEAGWLAKLFGPFGQALDSFSFKVSEIRTMDERLARAEMENVRLRTLMERNQYECRLAEASRSAKDTRGRLLASTRTSVGRTLASIDYRIPEHLLPSQLYTLGVSYLQARDDEKAVKILNHLLSLQDLDTYRNAKDYLLAGVAWYRIDNLDEADRHFAQVLEFEPDARTLPYFAQARLWRAVIAERSGQHTKAQHWMRELVDHHPQSPEAQWVNAKEAKRAVAGSRSARH